MKWTTANVKHPNYSENHEIYVGTHTGSFKKLTPANEKNAFAQKNLQDLSKLDKDSRITVLEFGNEEKSEILIGRGHNTVELHSLRCEDVTRTLTVAASPVVGLACYGADQIVAAFTNGQMQCVSLQGDNDISADVDPVLISTGDDMMHMRQCPVQRNLVATGGKGRQNNLKVFDMEVGGKKLFTSKNLPHDYLQLEVPVWDSDVGFIDSPHILATCSRYGYVRVYDTRKQRRPVQRYATEDQMSFATLAAHGNYIYTGTTMGALKAFDIRSMKTFVHTYKGFTGGITDLHLDDTGKYVSSASLDRYVRVHDVDSCVMLYQCYVKSKAKRVLIRKSMENPNNEGAEANELDDDEEKVQKSKKNNKKSNDDDENASDDEEFNEIFENMQTICESANNDEGDDDDDDDDDDDNNDETDSAAETKANTSKTKTIAAKRKSDTSDVGKNKKRKN